MLSWIVFAIVVVKLLFLSRHKRLGWLLALPAEGLFMFVVYPDLGLVAMSAAYAVLSAYSYLRWKKRSGEYLEGYEEGMYDGYNQGYSERDAEYQDGGVF